MHGHDERTERERSPSVFARAVETLAMAGGALATSLVLVMLALIAYAVTQRYVMGVPLTWADDLSSYLLVAFASMGVAEALRRGDHIAIDLLTEGSGAAGRRLFSIWSDLAILAFASVLCWSAWSQLKFAYDFGSYTNDQLELPAWIPLVPLVIGAALLALLALARIITGASREVSG